MLNKFSYLLIIALVFSLSACGGSAESDKPTAKTEEAAPAQSNESAIIPDPREVAYNEEESLVMKRFNELLAVSSKCEYVFYLPGYAMSTEVADPNQLKNFIYFVANKKAPRYDCDLEVGMALRNIETDEIHITIDAVVTKKECAMAKVTFDGKTHNMSLTEFGLQHIMQFLNIKPGQGAPIQK